MTILFVVDALMDWPRAASLPAGAPGTEDFRLLTARQYLASSLDEEAPARAHATRVINLCACTAYQSDGYYVSMLAEARGHQVLPDMRAIEDLREMHAADGMEEIDCISGISDISPLRGIASEPLTLTHQLTHQLTHRLSPRRARRQRPVATQASVAILRSPGSATMPSNQAAISKFQHAAEALGMRAQTISRDELGRLDEFDALFIRDTTSVNNYTYRIARQASLRGLVVMDDPASILRCSNKLFQHALLTRHGLPVPKSLLLHRDNLQQAIPALGVPLILKQPDSAFSMGVVKVETPQQLQDKAAVLLRQSSLLLAQEYLPTSFDWRIGVLDGKPLFACRYHMAPGHWQVIKHEGDSRYTEGLAEAVAVDAAPTEVIALALAAARLIGDGFYGVDIKQHEGQCKIIEINDNPNVDAGNEDGVLHDALYRQVFAVLRERIFAASERP